jgi:hypothetical protein
MSISGVSSIGVAYPIITSTQSGSARNPFAAFEQLASALQSGNLTSAHQAYNSLTSATQNSSRSQAGTQLSSDYTALGQALQSGNLPAARQAFSNLQQVTLQAGFGARGHHHHHGGGGASQSQSTANSNNAPDSLFNIPSTSNNTAVSSALGSIANTATTLLDILT